MDRVGCSHQEPPDAIPTVAQLLQLGYSRSATAGTLDPVASERQGGEAGSGRLVTLVFVAVVAAWIVVSQLVVQVLIGGNRKHPSTFTAIGGWTFLGLSGLLVAALAVREVASRREQKRLLTALSTITDPSLARLESETFFH